MRRNDPSEERLPAIGRPEKETAPTAQRNADFATEHDETAVTTDIITGRDKELEGDDSPRGWSGLEPNLRPD
ncbi:MAG TPA: hypothetical protein VF174_02890 [Micromonosporaceae bacterium]